MRDGKLRSDYLRFDDTTPKAALGETYEITTNTPVIIVETGPIPPNRHERRKAKSLARRAKERA